MNNVLFNLQSTLSIEMPRTLRHALKAAIEQQVPEAICERVLLCLSEITTNLYEHPINKANHVSVRFTRESDGWCLNVSDNGAAWDPTLHLKDDFLTEFSAIESGRGVALIHDQSDKLSYQPKTENTNRHNHLTLFWQFPESLQKHTILVVEDNQSLRLLYQAYLSQDYQVITAENGYQALEMLDQHNIDLILSDIRMPLMNGLSLRKKINQLSRNEIVPFAFITAQQDQLIQQQASELGIDDYLIKPVKKEQLVQVIKRILGRSNQVYQRLTTRIDKQITDSLQPTIPELSHGWRMQVATRNTGSGGGDLLLHHSFNDMTQILLTDIMGHDDSAKFFAHAYGGYLHGLMKSMPESTKPGQLLSELSQSAIKDKLLSQTTLTCSALQLSAQGTINIASAGHPAPLLISANEISELNVSGILPGLIDSVEYQDCQFTLQPGQRIALFTDGLFESAEDNETRDALQKHITQALLSTLNIPIEQALKQVMATFDKLTQAQPNDDTLLLLLEPITP